MAGMTHGKDFMGDVLLETDAARGRPGTKSGLSESVLDLLNLKKRGATFLEGPTGAQSCPLATQAGRMQT